MKRFNDIPQQLADRASANLSRRRRLLTSPQQVEAEIDGQAMLSFCSNDYLGLANHPDLIEALKEGAERYGVGGGASHLVNGHHLAHEQLEQALARFTGREAALLFSTGYLANVGVIAALMNRRDTVLMDKLNHASLIDGAQLSQAKFLRYRHNDMTHLGEQLSQAQGKALVVTDGVFSMDGDCAPLAEMAELAERHQAWVMVDDAHGFGTLGPQGRGLVAEAGLSSQQVPLVVGTLGKAFGTSGAFVAGDQATIDYLVQFARPYIYTTASSPAVAHATLKAIELVERADDARTNLRHRIDQLRTGLTELGYQLMPSHTPIQPILIGENQAALHLSAELEKRGLLVTAIRPPTVPEGTARLRVTLSATHSAEHVNTLLNAFEDLR